MNRTPLIGGIAALALLAGGGAAIAQQTGERPAPQAQRADADGDGRLSQAEFAARRLARLRAADANGDGSVSLEERRAMRAARSAARFDRIDADGDGAISRAEFDAASAARPGRGMRGARDRRGHGDRHQAMRSADPVSIAEIEARAARAFARLDLNGDGYLTAEERRARRGAMRMHGRGHMAPQASPTAPGSE